MINKKFIFILIVTLFFAALPLCGLEIPTLQSRVNDLAGVFDSRQLNELEQLLQEAESKTSSQVVLLTIPSLQDESLEDFSLRVVEKWKPGQKGLDNGVLVLVAMQERKIRIEVGYGLESILTDAKSGYIIRNVMIPFFKKGDYFQGIRDGLAAVTGLVNREFDISPQELEKYKQTSQKPQAGHVSIGFLFFILIVFLVLMRSRRSGGLLGALLLGSAMGGRSSHSSSGGFGGFSGGGGSFGGGGSSGSW